MKVSQSDINQSCRTMIAGFQHDVVLSHSAKDKTVLRLVAERLHVAVRQHLKARFDEGERRYAEMISLAQFLWVKQARL